MEILEIDFSDGFQQSDADAILQDCNAGDIVLEVELDGRITFHPESDFDYQAISCVLNHIKDSGATEFGSLGNDKYVTPESN